MFAEAAQEMLGRGDLLQDKARAARAIVRLMITTEVLRLLLQLNEPSKQRLSPADARIRFSYRYQGK